MSNHRQTLLASRPAAMVLALSLVGGLSAPFLVLPPVHAAYVVPAGTTELSATPVNQTKAVPPNIAVTFDDSGSMASAFLGDNRPFDNKGWGSQWRCAGVINPTAASGIGAQAMNGVYYNPDVIYLPPLYADGTSFPNAGDSSFAPTSINYLDSVWNDGVAANRPLNPQGQNDTTDFTNQTISRKTYYWQCYSDKDYNGNTYTGNLGQDGDHYGSLRVAGGSGGPYYYQLKASALATLQGQVDAYGNPTTAGLSTLYNSSNWEAVAVPPSQYQNWANWWAYYRTRNQMARTAISRAFGSPNLSAKTADGGYGGNFRVAWQNLYTSDTFRLQKAAVISNLTDAAGCSASNSATSSPNIALQASTTTTPPPCYRSAFFNWVFSVNATNDTPARAASIRAGQFFERGGSLDPNGVAAGDLHDPYWQPPPNGAYDPSANPGNELYCRQNFHMLVTDGYWNESSNYSTTGYVSPATNSTFPDGVNYSSSAASTQIFWNVRATSAYTPSQADIGFNFWATNLRPDLYDPTNGKFVPPYLPDTYTGLFGGGNVTGGNGATKNIPVEEYFNPENDPATWPHMVEYMVTLGVAGDLVHSSDYDCKTYSAGTPNDACALRTGKTTSDGSKGWPKPLNNNPTGIDDTWNATVNSRGDYFSAGNPQDLVNQLSNILTSISARAGNAATGAVNASVATIGAVSFSTSYSSLDWSGTLNAVTLNPDGTTGASLWSAAIPAASGRNVYTDSYKASTFASFAFTTANVGSFDSTQNSAGVGLQSPTLGASPDSVANRIDYLRGDQTHEADGTYRKRTTLLGAIINSQPVYVSYPSSNYYDSWPVSSPEAAAGAQKYSAFVAAHAKRAGTAYVGANDGMLHAFNAPVPKCTSYDVATGVCSAYNTGSNPGQEDWAFIPRAVYANLGNLTSVNNFQFRPTVDATPVTRDVFFSDQNWHTILAGGVGLGGRGVYALDITGAANSSMPATAPDKVLWEFDSDMTVAGTCVTNFGTCRGSDLGYTVSQPNVGRLNNGEWVTLVSNGYFPDCSQPDIPTPDKTTCAAVAAQAPKDASGNPYSALFVLDAQTGKMVAELKTPTGLTVNGIKVTSFGLATAVLGDYNSDQIDDVAFAGDLQGNLWRFDLSDPSPSNWKVTLAYVGIADAGGNQGLQPITTMPRLFPDPATGSFMVVFGTGKYLGAGDNSSNAVQGIYGIRDTGACGTAGGCATNQGQLVQQTLGEQTVNPPNPYQGATVRTDTNIAAPVSYGGWYIPLKIMDSSGTTQVNSGERVVVTPGAVFSSNMVIVQTLIAGAAGSDPCNPTTQGAVMVFNTNNGGPGTGVSSLGGAPVVGGRINNARTSGSLPVVSALGGGQFYIPGVTLSNAKNQGPFTGDSPIWRRRSWSEINQIQ
ncbi:MAG: PilC/PilY family type IV pilus protein [Pseudomonadota bacterium]